MLKNGRVQEVVGRGTGLATGIHLSEREAGKEQVTHHPLVPWSPPSSPA